MTVIEKYAIFAYFVFMNKKLFKTKGRAGRLDIIIGYNLRKYRRRAGLSQMELAQQLGLTFQQIQKYEGGRNRISAALLYKLSGILEVSLQDFYKGLDD